MNEIKLNMDEKGHGAFVITDAGEQIGEMEVSIVGNDMTVYHTEVSPKAEGRGIGKKLLSAMVAHARKQALKVTALCPFVHAQFKRHAAEYADIWKGAQ